MRADNHTHSAAAAGAGNGEKLKEKVQKLLNQAKDREGTPEGETFYAKAFSLMAEYGIDQRDLDQPDEGDAVTHRTYTFKHSYTEMQAGLLHAIASGLHCTGFTHRVYNSTRVESATIFGLKCHLERVDMLYGMLLPVMLAGAQRVRARNLRESTVIMRRSFMSGYASEIRARLAEAEVEAAGPGSEYALVLIDDFERASRACDDYAAAKGFYLSQHETNRSFDPGAYLRGKAAGERSDLGQTRVGARPALPF